MPRQLTHEEYINKYGDKISPNVEIISRYVNAQTKMTCKCKMCGKQFDIMPTSLNRGCGCIDCGFKLTGAKRRSTHDVFIQKMSIVNSNIKILSRYSTSNVKVECECLVCGHTWSATPNHLLKGKGCPNCYYLSKINTNLTEEERANKRHYPKYYTCLRETRKRDNYTCQLTGATDNVVVHHIVAYSTDPTKKDDINNCITLSESIHKEFHSRYGYGNNTKEQFVEFVNDLYTENRLTKSAYIWVMEERLKINNHLLSGRKERQ